MLGVRVEEVRSRVVMTIVEVKSPHPACLPPSRQSLPYLVATSQNNTRTPAAVAASRLLSPACEDIFKPTRFISCLSSHT